MRTTLLAATAAIALLAGMSPADATLMVSAEIGGVAVLHCNDNQAASALCPGGDQNLAIGTLQLANNTFAGITVNGSVQTSTGQGGGTDILNTSNLNLINTTGITAHIVAAVGDIGFKGPATTYSLSDAGTWQLANNSTISDKFWIDVLNGQGAEDANDHPGTLLQTFNDTAVGAADAYSNAVNDVPFNSPATFSMTQQFTLDLVGGGSLNNSGRVQLVTPTVSEPGTLGLLGASLIGTGLALRRRRSNPCATEASSPA